MITKELVLQWYSLSKDSYEFAQRAAAHGAAQREKELMAVGMEPKQYIGVDDEPDFTYYTATQLAAARLQGAEEARSRILNMTLPELAADDWLNAGKGEHTEEDLTVTKCAECEGTGGHWSTTHAWCPECDGTGEKSDHPASVNQGLLEALKRLLSDIEEYQTINHLGGENNHWQVIARATIAGVLNES